MMLQKFCKVPGAKHLLRKEQEESRAELQVCVPEPTLLTDGLPCPRMSVGTPKAQLTKVKQRM